MKGGRLYRHSPCGGSDSKDRSYRLDHVGTLVSGDATLQAAVLHHLTAIGEVINRLSPPLRDRHPEVPWHQIVSVRNRIVHAYFDLDWQILWVAAIEDIPALRRQIAAILENEFHE